MVPCNKTQSQHYHREVLRCRRSFPSCCATDCQILADSGRGGGGVPFRLWPEQQRVEHSRLRRLCGHDGKVGWLSTSKGKALLYDGCADAFRNGEVTLHSFATVVQLASIEGATLRAPEGEADDRADAWALACRAMTRLRRDQAQGGGVPRVWQGRSYG